MKRISILLLPLLLAGCAALNSLSSTSSIVLSATVEFAAAKYIASAGAKPAQVARAQKIHSIAAQIQAIDTGAVSIAQLEAQLTADIARLPVADQILAAALFQLVLEDVGVRTTTGVLGATVTAQVNVLMGDIIAAAALYGG